MAYQDWLTQASNTSAVSSNIPPALIPAGNSVLNEQPVPSSYTSNQAQRTPGNTAISSQGQINSIMNSINPQTGTTNPFSTPGGGGGGGPSSWSAYSSGGAAGPSGPGTGTGNTGVTQNYGNSVVNPASGDAEGEQNLSNLQGFWGDNFQTYANPNFTPGQNVLGTGSSWGDLANEVTGAYTFGAWQPFTPGTGSSGGPATINTSGGLPFAGMGPGSQMEEMMNYGQYGNAPNVTAGDAHIWGALGQYWSQT